MKAHVFHYKWPRIKEGLVHVEESVIHSWAINSIRMPTGAFLYIEERWHTMLRAKASWSLVDDYKVPKEIRAMALLLT